MSYCLGKESPRVDWHLPSSHEGYRFVPLLTPGALRAEGVRMQNCVAAYRSRVAACVV